MRAAHSFKLNYPPVELGAVKVKHYNPDYVPAIRKKAFWIIEAKSPKDVNYPFDFMYLVQGLQCCIHPEIQAQYLVVSNGLVSSVFDAHGAVFLGQDVYTPILESRSSQVPSRWAEIYDLLGVEKLRSRIELNLNKPMTNCACRVLTRIIPAYCWNALEHLPENMRKLSQKRVNAMYVEKVKKRQG